MEDLTIFDQRITIAQQRLEALWQESHAAGKAENALLTTALTEFGQALEELQVASEELREQNSALLAAHQALAEERRRYQQLFDFAPNGYLVTDTQGIIEEANQAVGKLFQVATNFLVGKPLSLYIADGDRQLFRNFLALLGAEQDLLAIESILGLKLALQPRNGSHIPFFLTVSPVHNAAGQVVTLRWLLHDISEHAVTEEVLLQSEVRNRSLLESIPDGLLSIHRAGTFLDVKAPKNFPTAFSADQMIGKNVVEVFPSGLGQQMLAYLQVALERGVIQTFEYEIDVAGKLASREARIVPASHDYGLVMVRDLTQQKAVEAEKNLLFDQVSQQHVQLRHLTGRLAEVQEAERKHFARELHDQVGQTMTALALNLNLLKIQLTAQGPVSPFIQSRLTDSLQLLEQMMSSVRDVLSGLHSPVLDDYGLLAGLAAHSNRVQELARGLIINVTGSEPDPRLPTTVENAFYRITQEALTNIVRHAQATRVTVRLQTIGKRVRLTITDNGQGFALEDRADAATQRPSWGLLIMRERAEAVGAQFQIISRVGQGTTVKIEVAHPAKA